MLEVCSDAQREEVLGRVRDALAGTRRYSASKVVVNRLEKLLATGTRLQSTARGRALPDDEALAAAAAARRSAGSASDAEPSAGDGAAEERPIPVPIPVPAPEVAVEGPGPETPHEEEARAAEGPH